MRLLLGGSPCTHWSIAQTKNRETEPSGVGWDLFENYLIALDKFKPDFFLYENNKSMSKAIREEITRRLGVEPICINSALVSAQNRQRLYWTNIPSVQQPEDRGVLLRDILETGAAWREKGYTLRAAHGPHGGESSVIKTIKEPGKFSFNGAAEPVSVSWRGRGYVSQFEARNDGKSASLTTGHQNRFIASPARVGSYPTGKGEIVQSQSKRIYSVDGKACSICASVTGGNSDTSSPATRLYAEPVRIGTIESHVNNENFDSRQYRVYSPDGKSVTLCGQGGGVGAKTGIYAAPWAVPEATKLGHTVIGPGECVDLAQPNSKTRRGRRMSDKSNCLTTSCAFYEYCGTLDRPVYHVENGQITINGKQYPIKLADGCYIIRKLTVAECKRLQTVPDSYVFPVSDTQAYKMLGNGWTVDVIAHILSYCPRITSEPLDVLSMYDGMVCGHIALDKLGARIARYRATEIDKYAIKTACYNFPDIEQLGDAFQVREWKEESDNAT
nr:DNA cytosine methyltransferase [Flavonifractor sp. An92]